MSNRTGSKRIKRYKKDEWNKTRSNRFQKQSSEL